MLKQAGIYPLLMRLGTMISHEHTRVGTVFQCTALVAAHCPALNTGTVSTLDASERLSLRSLIYTSEQSYYYSPPFWLQFEEALKTDIHILYHILLYQTVLLFPSALAPI